MPSRPGSARGGRRAESAQHSVVAALDMLDAVLLHAGRRHLPRGALARRRAAGAAGGCRARGSTCACSTAEPASAPCAGAGGSPAAQPFRVPDRLMSLPPAISIFADATRSPARSPRMSPTRCAANPRACSACRPDARRCGFTTSCVARRRTGDVDFSQVTTFNLDEFVGIAAGASRQLPHVHAAPPLRSREPRSGAGHISSTARRPIRTRSARRYEAAIDAPAAST